MNRILADSADSGATAVEDEPLALEAEAEASASEEDAVFWDVWT